MASTSSCKPSRGPARDPPTEPAPHNQPQKDGGLGREVRCGKNPKDHPPKQTDSIRTGPSTSSPPGQLSDGAYDPAFDEPVLPEHDSVRPARGPAFGYNVIETEAEALVLGGRLDPKMAKRPDSPIPNDTFLREGERKDRCEGDISAAHPRSHFEPPISPIHNPQPWVDVEAPHTLVGAGEGSQVEYKYSIETGPQKRNFDPPKYHPKFVKLQEGNTSMTDLRAPSEDGRQNCSKWPMRYSATQRFPSLGMRYPPIQLQGVAQEHKEHPVFQRCTCGDITLVGQEHCTLAACIRRLMTATGLDVYEDAPAAERVSRDFLLGYEAGLELRISRMWWRISPQEWLRQVEVHKEISKAECEKRHLHIQNLRLKRDQRLELANEGTIISGKGRGLGSLCPGSMEMAEREVVDDIPLNLAAETWETWEKVHTDIPTNDLDEPFDEEDEYSFYGVDNAERSWGSD